MSEPTPLSAALERAISARLLERPPTDPGEFPEFVAHVRAQLGYKDATIDAQATEIAALKGALEKTAEFLNGLAKADALPIGIADIQQEGARLDAIVLRVLAGKEAQR